MHQPTLELQIQEYIKIPLSGLPEFITRFSSLVKIDCGPIKAIGDTIKDLDPTWDNSVYNAVWPNELDTVSTDNLLFPISIFHWLAQIFVVVLRTKTRNWSAIQYWVQGVLH